MEKMGLNKFTYIALIKNDAQLKQKKKKKVTNNQKKKKEQSPKFIKKLKIMSQIKNYRLFNIYIYISCLGLENQKKKKRIGKKRKKRQLP